MTNPLVSVIIPAFNAERFIRRCLDSVLSQTYTHFEAIIIDDGSTDNTAAISREFCQADARIRMFSQGNGGVARARNLGIRQSSGELIAPLDADDIWYPEKLQKQVEAIGRVGEAVGLVYTWGFAIDESENLIHAFGSDFQGDVFWETILFSVVGMASTPLFRKRCLDVVGHYDPAFRDNGVEGYEDWDLEIRISRRYQLALVPDYLVGYRWSAGSMSHNVHAMQKAGEAVLNKLQRDYPEIPRTLIRWRRSRDDFSWAVQFLREKHLFRALSLFFRSVTRDPVQILWPLTVGAYVRRRAVGFSRLLMNLGLPFHVEITEDTLRRYHVTSLRSPDILMRILSWRLKRLKARRTRRNPERQGRGIT